MVRQRVNTAARAAMITAATRGTTSRIVSNTLAESDRSHRDPLHATGPFFLQRATAIPELNR